MKEIKQELEALSVSLNELKEAMNSSINLLDSRIESILKKVNKELNKYELIPFDIEKAKQGAKVMTREGCDVRILCYDHKREDYPIVAEIIPEDNSKEAHIETHTNDGRYYSNGTLSENDLFIAEECV